MYPIAYTYTFHSAVVGKWFARIYCTNYFKLSIVLVQFLSLAVWLLFYVILSKTVDMSGNLHDWYPIGYLCNHVKSCVSENVGSFCTIYALLEARLCIFAGSSDWNKRSIGHFLLSWQTYQCISRCRLIRQKSELDFFFHYSVWLFQLWNVLIKQMCGYRQRAIC